MTETISSPPPQDPWSGPLWRALSRRSRDVGPILTSLADPEGAAWSSIDTLTGPDGPLTKQERRDGIIARRNLLPGLWAAARLGLTGQDAEPTPVTCIRRPRRAGPRRVVAKLAVDLASHGAAVRGRGIGRTLCEMEARTERELAPDHLKSAAEARGPLAGL